MPPSGFSKGTIEGLLEFVSDSYEQAERVYKETQDSEQGKLAKSIAYLEDRTRQTAETALDGRISEKGIRGLVTFVTGNFRDLIQEIQQGKKREGYALKTEVESIGKYLSQFKL
jgi:hypothetical protein